MKTLYLEKRGCDFWKDSQELRDSDLENYRLFGQVSKHQWVEVCTSSFKKSKYSKFRVVKSSVDDYHEKLETVKMYNFEKKKQWVAYRDLTKVGYTETPNKEGVLKYINKMYNKNFKKLIIVDRLEDIKNGNTKIIKTNS